MVAFSSFILFARFAFDSVDKPTGIRRLAHTALLLVAFHFDACRLFSTKLVAKPFKAERSLYGVFTKLHLVEAHRYTSFGAYRFAFKYPA